MKAYKAWVDYGEGAPSSLQKQEIRQKWLLFPATAARTQSTRIFAFTGWRNLTTCIKVNRRSTGTMTIHGLRLCVISDGRVRSRLGNVMGANAVNTVRGTRKKVLTMAEYIRREDVIAWFMPYAHVGESIDADVVISDIKGMKAADVAPVVRCKDCKYRYSDSWCEYVDDDNFYCARGERKEGADNEP